MKVFLISGKARHGKDTIGDFIMEYYHERGIKPIKTAYAKYIKMFTKEITGWDGNEENKESARKFMQEVSTEIIRNKMGQHDFFVKRMIDDIKVYENYTDVVIIADVRFEIEIDYIKKYYDNVINIRVIRSDFNSELTDKEKQHETETALSDEMNYDYKIINTTLEKLKTDVYKILEGIDENEKTDK